MILPPERIADVLLRNPENRMDGRFRISDFGMGTGIWGGTWFSRRVNNKVGFVAEVTKSFCQEAKVTLPEKLVGVNGQVGVKEDFQRIVRLIEPYKRMLTKLSQSECNKNIY